VHGVGVEAMEGGTATKVTTTLAAPRLRFLHRRPLLLHHALPPFYEIEADVRLNFPVWVLVDLGRVILGRRRLQVHQVHQALQALQQVDMGMRIGDRTIRSRSRRFLRPL
jgi:hypothetical protein